MRPLVVFSRFWAIGAIALIWSVMGVINFFVQMNADALASFPETHRAVIEGRPAWATGSFAITVFGGVVGCLLLLLRKSAAYYLFIASLLGVIVTMPHTLGIVSSTIDFSAFEILMMFLIPLAVMTFLIWHSKLTRSKGWIRQEQQMPGYNKQAAAANSQ